MKVFPPFQLDTANQCLWRITGNGIDERITLKPKVYSILEYFVNHPGRLVTQQELLDAIWRDTHVQPEVLKRHIFDVREVLGDDPKSPVFLETLPRRGYQFIAPVQNTQTSIPHPVLPGIRLVGRDRPLDELDNRLRRAMDSQRQMVFVTGEPGIGKTALVEEFQRRAAEAIPLRLAAGQCVEGYGGKEPYYPVLNALGLLSRDSDVVDVLATHAPTWLVQFPSLVRQDQREILQREIVGATGQRMLREIGVALQVLSSDKPLLLVIEDLHWADPSTIDLISILARSRAPAKLMVIATYRPADVTLSGHPLKSVEQDLLVHRLCYRLAVDPLQEHEIARYLAGDSPESDVPQGLAALLLRQSEGNPLFMLAALEHLEQRGFILNESGVWTLCIPLHKMALEVPDGLRDMIGAQIDNLDPEVQQILEAASVNGVRFSVAVSNAVASADEERFEQICEDLSRRDRLLRAIGAGRFPDGTMSSHYEFSHALYREVLYRRQPPVRRARMHQQIGDRLEQLYSNREDTVAAELAEHFEYASNWSRALKYLCVAAESARRRFANREAGDMLRRALKLSAHLPENERAVWDMQILTALGMMYAADSDVRAIEAIESVVNLATRYASIDVQVRALGDWLLPLSWTSTRRSMEAADRYLTLCERQSGVVRAMARQNGHFFRIWLGEWNDADAAECLNALHEIRESGDRIAHCYFEAQYALLRWASSEYREAERILSQSVANLEACDATPLNVLLVHWVHQIYGTSGLAMAGEWSKAVERFENVISGLEKNGDEYRARQVRLYLAWTHLHMLDFHGVLRHCACSYPNPEIAAYSEDPILGDPVPVDARICLTLRGTANLGAGHIDAALKDLSIVRDAMDRQQVLLDWYWRMPLHSALAELWLAKGDIEKANSDAKAFLRASLATRERTHQALGWEINARVATLMGDRTRAEECIAKALNLIEQFEIPLAAWRVHATAAEGAAHDSDLARAHWSHSAQILIRLADSLSPQVSLREIFLSAPPVQKILANGYS
jgi:DNA-binding winged helix-turn-helix (wHTH) protein